MPSNSHTDNVYQLYHFTTYFISDSLGEAAIKLAACPLPPPLTAPAQAPASLPVSCHRIRSPPLACLRHCLAILDAALGAGHPNTQTVRRNYAAFLDARDDARSPLASAPSRSSRLLLPPIARRRSMPRRRDDLEGAAVTPPLAPARAMHD